MNKDTSNNSTIRLIQKFTGFGRVYMPFVVFWRCIVTGENKVSYTLDLRGEPCVPQKPKITRKK